MSTQRERLEKFRSLHAAGRILVLPNAWDAASARMVQELGAEAIATSSAAVAWCHGYADGETMPTEVALRAAKEIVRVVSIPVSVDSEAGYSSDPAKVAEYACALIEAGAVGMNLEDGKSPPELLVAKIRGIKQAAKTRDADIFINARCDAYLQDLVPDDRKLEEMIRRGKLYRDAGADSLFAPGMSEPAQIRDVVQAIDLPVNILILKTVPPIAELKALGVRRVSAGALTGRAAYGAAQRATKMLLSDGNYDELFASSGDCPNFNGYFGAH